jgi:hypothetical protein
VSVSVSFALFLYICVLKSKVNPAYQNFDLKPVFANLGIFIGINRNFNFFLKKPVIFVFRIALQNTVGDLRNEIELLRKNTLATIRRIIQGDIAVTFKFTLPITMLYFRDEKRCKNSGRKCRLL